MTRCSTHKHIGIYLDEKVNSFHHITEETAKGKNKSIDYIKKLNNFLPRGTFLTIKKHFTRSNWDYEDVINDQPNNDLLYPT